MKTASDPRHRHRAQMIQHLFAASFHEVKDPIIATIWQSLPKIDPQIESAAPEWPLPKLNPIDLAILRLATFEILIDKKAPIKVIIDEAIELAKEFGSSGSPAFINGALGKIVQNYES
jgi:N utilization substance protein B